MVNRRLRELAGLPRVAITEDMALAKLVNGKWTDGTYTDGDPITYNGQGMNIEFEPDHRALGGNQDTGQPVEGAWYAINNDGEEIEFEPGMEDRHDPQNAPAQAFPEGEQIDEAPYGDFEAEQVRKKFNKVMHDVERLERYLNPTGSLASQIDAIGGDSGGIEASHKAAEDLYRSLEEAMMYALSHLDNYDE